MGRPSERSSLLGHPSARFLEPTAKTFHFCFSSLAERLAAARSGQGRAGFRARRERTLDGEDRCETLAAEEKSLHPTGSSHDGKEYE
jgi:hypothetical protein